MSGIRNYRMCVHNDLFSDVTVKTVHTLDQYNIRTLLRVSRLHNRLRVASLVKIKVCICSETRSRPGMCNVMIEMAR